MTVKELLISIDFSSVVERLKKRYGTTESLRPLHIYKEDYDILSNIEYSGKGRRITYDAATGVSDIYMIEGDCFNDIIGSEINLSSDSPEIRTDVVAEILWSASPFGRFTAKDWNALSDYLVNSPAQTLSENAKRARRFYFLQYLPYCKDKQMRSEVLEEMVRPVDEIDEVAFSLDTLKWLHMRSKRKLNRSKRKREYRMQKRYNELVNLERQEHFLNSLKRIIGEIPKEISEAISKSRNIDTQSYISCTFGKSDRIEYVSNLLLNPLYVIPGQKSSTDNKFVCVALTSRNNPFSEREYTLIKAALARKYKTNQWYLLCSIDDTLGKEIRLEIHKLKY